MGNIPDHDPLTLAAELVGEEVNLSWDGHPRDSLGVVRPGLSVIGDIVKRAFGKLRVEYDPGTDALCQAVALTALAELAQSRRCSVAVGQFGSHETIDLGRLPQSTADSKDKGE